MRHIQQWKIRAMCFLPIVAINTIPAICQDCSEVLKFANDVRKIGGSTEISNSVLQTLAKYDLNSYAEANVVAASLGVQLPELPIGFSGRGSQDGFKSGLWSSNLATLLAQSSSQRTTYFEEFQQANSTVIGAWLECMKSQSGLAAWAKQTAVPNEIMLTIQLVKPRSENDWRSLDTLRIVEIQHSDNVSIDEKQFVGKKLGLAVMPIFVKRNPSMPVGSVNFIVRTNVTGYDVSCSMIVGPTVRRVTKTFTRPSNGSSSGWTTTEFAFDEPVVAASVTSVSPGDGLKYADDLTKVLQICILPWNQGDPDKVVGRRWKISFKRDERFPVGQVVDFTFIVSGLVISNVSPKESPFYCGD